MQIAQLMTREVATCRQTDMLDRAAELMWDRDIGFVAVVDDRGMLVGAVTDRDACMAAFMEHQALHALPISLAMSKHVVTCRPDDTTTSASELMAKHQIRRLIVVDDDEKPVGVVSLNDLALAAARRGQVPPAEVTRALGAICAHRVAPSA